MKHLLFPISVLLCAMAAQAQVSVKNAWVRATVHQQNATGAFMQLQSGQHAKLVSAQSPVAGVVEVHEMSMAEGVMKMRAVPGVALPAGKVVEFKPGGFHVMLMDLKGPIKEGDHVPMTLVVENASGKKESLEIQIPVRKSAMSASPQGDGHAHKH